MSSPVNFNSSQNPLFTHPLANEFDPKVQTPPPANGAGAGPTGPEAQKPGPQAAPKLESKPEPKLELPNKTEGGGKATRSVSKLNVKNVAVGILGGAGVAAGLTSAAGMVFGLVKGENPFTFATDLGKVSMIAAIVCGVVAVGMVVFIAISSYLDSKQSINPEKVEMLNLTHQAPMYMDEKGVAHSDLNKPAPAATSIPKDSTVPSNKILEELLEVSDTQSIASDLTDPDMPELESGVLSSSDDQEQILTSGKPFEGREVVLDSARKLQHRFQVEKSGVDVAADAKRVFAQVEAVQQPKTNGNEINLAVHRLNKEMQGLRKSVVQHAVQVGYQSAIDVLEGVFKQQKDKNPTGIEMGRNIRSLILFGDKTIVDKINPTNHSNLIGIQSGVLTNISKDIARQIELNFNASAQKNDFEQTMNSLETQLKAAGTIKTSGKRAELNANGALFDASALRETLGTKFGAEYEASNPRFTNLVEGAVNNLLAQRASFKGEASTAEIARLTALLGNTLTVSKETSKQFKTQVTEAYTAVDTKLAAEEFAAKQAVVQVKLDTALPQLKQDRALLQTALINMLTKDVRDLQALKLVKAQEYIHDQDLVIQGVVHNEHVPNTESQRLIAEANRIEAALNQRGRFVEGTQKNIEGLNDQILAINEEANQVGIHQEDTEVRAAQTKVNAQISTLNAEVTKAVKEVADFVKGVKEKRDMHAKAEAIVNPPLPTMQRLKAFASSKLPSFGMPSFFKGSAASAPAAAQTAPAPAKMGMFERLQNSLADKVSGIFGPSIDANDFFGSDPVAAKPATPVAASPSAAIPAPVSPVATHSSPAARPPAIILNNAVLVPAMAEMLAPMPVLEVNRHEASSPVTPPPSPSSPTESEKTVFLHRRPLFARRNSN